MSDPLSKAHNHAQLAEKSASQGHFDAAIEQHLKAAGNSKVIIENFLTALAYTSDAEAAKSLKLLYSAHTNHAKDLQKRLKASSESKPSTTSFIQPTSRQFGTLSIGSRNYFIGQPVGESAQFSTVQLSTPALPNTTSIATVAAESLDASVATQDQSYMFLHDSLDLDDPFHKFWSTVGNLVSRFSLPSAVATTSTNRQELDESMLDSYLIVPSRNIPAIRQPVDESIHERYPKTIEEYHLENEQLKATLDQLSRKLNALERVNGENQLLKSSIIQFKSDYSRLKTANRTEKSTQTD